MTCNKTRHLDRRRAASSRVGVERSLYLVFVLAVACFSPFESKGYPESFGQVLRTKSIHSYEIVILSQASRGFIARGAVEGSEAYRQRHCFLPKFSDAILPITFRLN
jgi:hypothetical protein